MDAVGRRYLGDANEGSGVWVSVGLFDGDGVFRGFGRGFVGGAPVCVAEVSATYGVKRNHRTHRTHRREISKSIPLFGAVGVFGGFSLVFVADGSIVVGQSKATV